VDEIERQARALAYGCGFTRVPAFRFTEEAAGVEELERERDLAKQLGLPAVLEPEPILSARSAGALRFEGQAQIQPLDYADGLAAGFVAAGGRLFEQTPVVSVDDAGVEVRTGHRVGARYVVHATHTPVGVVPLLQARLTAVTSYVLAARLAAPVPPGLHWDDASPYHYLRSVGEGTLLVAGGEDHRTGRERHPSRRHSALERWVRERLAVRHVEARWSHELFESADGLPYIGFLPGSSAQLVATGFAGTGLAFGTLAAMLIAELVTGGACRWRDLYAPQRLGPLSTMPHTAGENLRVGWRFVADRLRAGLRSALHDLPEDSGRLARVEGHLVAAYRDLRGDLHALSPRCTHLGCLVAWNDAEGTWDCPCHGGRFHATGKVLYGPPVRDLERMPIDPEEAEPEEEG
jgi:glycine/D-amino acid oxidase-like deaminating enzyme/nitrite reductase/ring-hydroxylating ferredoxin subunit